MKSKFYCQLCKFGVDSGEGFRAHLVSARHLLQREAYDRNPTYYTEYNSGKFARQFLKVLRTKFGTTSVSVNTVYLAYLAEPNCVSLTRTKWVTLPEFLDWIAYTLQGKCAVTRCSESFDHSIQLVDDTSGLLHDPASKQNMTNHLRSSIENPESKSSLKRKNQDLAESSNTKIVKYNTKEATDESKPQQQIPDDPFNINDLIKKACSFRIMTTNTLKEKREWTLSRSRVAFSLKCPWHLFQKQTNVETEPYNACNSSNPSIEAIIPQPKSGRPSSLALLRRSALQEDWENERERESRCQNWLCQGIVVKIITKRLGSKYLGKDAVVQDMKHLYTALLEMLDSKELLYADQTHLKTVVPETGERVMIVNGGYRNRTGILKNKITTTSNRICSVQIDSGLLNGRVVGNISFADVAKYVK